METAELQAEVQVDDIKSLWVFAYGSLCWRPGFQFHKAVTGCVKGFQRRFWQGNVTHRGTVDRPGRVATLVEDHQGLVPGVAFAVSGEAAIPYLSRRETELGGYASEFTTFYPKQGNSFKVLVYLAKSSNALWMGDDDAKTIAQQVVNCRGASGHNVEYVIRLADFMRDNFSSHYDDHLFELEKEVLALVHSKKMCMKSLMGNGDGCIAFVKKEVQRSPSNAQDGEQDRAGTCQFSERLQGKKLRCMNL
ncbi:unnamed protein product [Phaedon cochleariae]|uniref:glutathione-specific gamma-glutamylcyclotransferase n=1 Tax=Phaedon cochleariae TaxID=80249 RepID=A0A9N9SEP5_PHACE|nr:unnamed protein product [Phaedon cochleariae]